MEAPGPSPWRQGTGKVVWKVGGLAHNTDSLAGLVRVIKVQEGGERGTSDFSYCIYYALQGSVVGGKGVSKSPSEAAGQYAFSSASVEGAHDG